MTWVEKKPLLRPDWPKQARKRETVREKRITNNFRGKNKSFPSEEGKVLRIPGRKKARSGKLSKGKGTTDLRPSQLLEFIPDKCPSNCIFNFKHVRGTRRQKKTCSKLLEIEFVFITSLCGSKEDTERKERSRWRLQTWKLSERIKVAALPCLCCDFIAIYVNSRKCLPFIFSLCEFCDSNSREFARFIASLAITKERRKKLRNYGNNPRSCQTSYWLN